VIAGKVKDLAWWMGFKMQWLIWRIQAFFRIPERTTTTQAQIEADIKAQAKNAKTANEIEIVEETQKAFDESAGNLEVKQDNVIDPILMEKVITDFDSQIMSSAWVTVDGKNYRMNYVPQGRNGKWEWQLLIDGR
jgi:hypothetical protein